MSDVREVADLIELIELEESLDDSPPCEARHDLIHVPCSHEVTHLLTVSCIERQARVCLNTAKDALEKFTRGGLVVHDVCLRDIHICWDIRPI